MKLCEDCGNYVDSLKEINGLLCCPNCFKMRSARRFEKVTFVIVDRRKLYIKSGQFAKGGVVFVESGRNFRQPAR